MRPVLLAGLLVALAAFGDETEITFDPVTAAEVQAHVDILSGDEFEGRQAGTDGERLAADYIVERLEELRGLEPGGEDGTWFQAFRIPGPEDLDARNVLAILPGSDPDLADETIVIGAHYDHVGYGFLGASLEFPPTGNIHNGADDNASGSAVLLELAEALATSPDRPRRTIMFQWYSGEEMGLVGSRYYTRNPLRPIEDTVFMVNMDMVGRLVGRTLLVGGTGTSPDLPALVAELCAEHDFILKEEVVGAAPSDNASFYHKDVPALFCFTGVHADYHRSTDDADKLNAEGAAQVGQLVLDMVRAVDARDERLEFTRAPGSAEYWGPSPFLGVVCVVPRAGEIGAARVNFLFPDSPAVAAGLREGDLVLALDGEALESLGDLERRLKLEALLDPETFELKPVTFRVFRAGDEDEDDELLEIEVQPVVK
jgi:hypothetical protein